MCIIVYKPEGIVLPKDDVLEECFISNPDGAGWLMRTADDRVLIQKGFMSIDSLLDSIHSIRHLTDRELVIHFRWATHGSKSQGNTHPFPITKKKHMLRSLSTVCDYALMHNGIVSSVKNKDDTLSDTMCLVKLIAGSSEFTKYVQDILKLGKYIIMDSRETRMYGKFIVDSACFFSNTSYKFEYTYLNQAPSYGGRWSCDDKITDIDISDGNRMELVEWYNKKHGTKCISIYDIIEDVEMLAELEEMKAMQGKKRVIP
jgi:predicted glutamine amidotransferase